MAVNLSPYGGVGAQFLDNSGNVLTGGKIYTYAAGTTTPQVTYTTNAGNIPHSNPIILDAAGRIPGGEIWLTDGLVYKFILRDANDVLIATYDGVIGINSNFVAFTNQQEIQTATAGQTVFDLATMSYQPGTNSLSVFVDGVNQYGPGAQYAYLETDSDTVTFLNGLHVGAEVKFTTSQLNSSVSQADAFQVSYTPPFTGSTATNVGNKLAQTVSIVDFGAVGDGVTDNSAAINAALDYVGQNGGGGVYIPNGIFGIRNIFIKYSNVTLYGNGPGSWLKQIGSPYSNFAVAPSGSIFSSPSSAIVIAPPAFEWGDDQNPDTSTVGTVASIYLKNFRLSGWWLAPPPPYNGYNINITGQPYNDRSAGILAVCSAEIYYDGLIISQMGAENSYSWNANISNCWIVGGGEVGSLGIYGKVTNCRVQNAYNQNGVGARLVANNLIFAMPNSGIYIGGSSQTSGSIIENNYVFDCDGYSLFAFDDGATTVAKTNYIINDNVFLGKTGMVQNSIVVVDFRAAGSTVQIANNYITVPDNINGLFFGPCQGEYSVTNNIIKGTGVGVQNGIDLNNIGTSCFVAISENIIDGFTNKISPTTNNAKISKGINYLGDTVINGSDTLKVQTTDNLKVNQNIIYKTTADLVTSPTVTYSPVANQAMKQCQFTGSSLTVNPPSGYQIGQVFILEIFNASGSPATVTMNTGSAPAAYKGSLTSGVSLNNTQRVIVQMVYITNTWLQTSIATL